MKKPVTEPDVGRMISALESSEYCNFDPTNIPCLLHLHFIHKAVIALSYTFYKGNSTKRHRFVASCHPPRVV
jgi:hypothetical protein